MKKQSNNGGFTLVEVIVYMLLSSIVLVVVGQMLGSMNGLFVNTRTRSEAKQIGDAVYSYLAEELRYATYLGVHDPTAADHTGDTQLCITDGKLVHSGSDVFGQDFYLGKQLEIETAQITAYSLRLTVRVLDSDGIEQYDTSSTVECINLKLAGKSMMYDAAQGTNPTITYTRGTKA